jgi:hypothetical protein
MVNGLFNKNPKCGGGNTVFGISNHLSIVSRVHYYTPHIIDEARYDFNIKIKYINHILHRIFYHDYDFPIYSMQNGYSIILKELAQIKSDDGDGYGNDSVGNYNVLLKNIISTFEALESTFVKYIKRNEIEYELPHFIYEHIDLLTQFIKDLYDEDIPDQKIDKINEELETVLFNLYKNVGSDLEHLLKLYSTGNYTKLQEELTYEVYNKLAQSLFNESYDKSIGYTNVYSALNRALEGLYKSTLIEEAHKNEIADLNGKLDLAKNPAGGLLSVTAQMEVIAEVKPEILEYIRLYGFPEGAVFETGKLAEITKRLNR